MFMANKKTLSHLGSKIKWTAKFSSSQKMPQYISDFRMEVFFVPKAGIEPAHPRIHDFESCASTSSATLAFN